MGVNMHDKFSPIGREAYSAVYNWLAQKMPRDLLDSIAEPLVGASHDDKCIGIGKALKEFETALVENGDTSSFGKTFVLGDLLLDHITALEAKRHPCLCH
jgi:hypothetical protein